MTPKEKATELISKFSDEAYKYRQCTPFSYDKACALICVDEIIKHHPQSPMTHGGSYKYWEQVKAEIEKL
jgi:hypothetical protein